MDTRYPYLKTRADFGKQCIFDFCGPNVDEEIRPRLAKMREYVEENPYTRGTQFTRDMALHTVQTEDAHKRKTGMYHFEGGWPKEINPIDVDAATRFRRRVERDDEYQRDMQPLLEEMEYEILLNNAVNIHIHYFDDMIPTPLVYERSIRVMNVYADHEVPPRRVNCLAWSPEGYNVAVSYCVVTPWQGNPGDFTAYIWQIENASTPRLMLHAPVPIVATEFNPRDPSLLASGLMTGEVCFWDIRHGVKPVQTSTRRWSHLSAATTVKWAYTKMNTEFYTSSSDGQALWWDIRKLTEPTERLIFDLKHPNEPSIENSIGITSSNFEVAMSTKFLFGLQNGLAISGSRKSKTAAEKLSSRFAMHESPVTSIDRNGFVPKLFLTVGGWSVELWAEDTKEDSLLLMNDMDFVPVCACWNKARCSLFYLITNDGELRAYDIIEGFHKPIIKLHLSEQPLTAMAAHEDGKFLIAGDEAGTIFLTESSDTLAMADKASRNILGSLIERASRCTKAVDARLKEIKILLKEESSAEMPTGKAATRDKQRSKRQSKSRERAKKDRDKGKDKGKDKGAKEKAKKPQTPRKRVKDDSPEVVEAEQQYFSVIQQSRDTLPADASEDVILAKKLDLKSPRQKANNLMRGDESDEEEEEEGKKQKKKKKKRKKEEDVTAEKRSPQAIGGYPMSEDLAASMKMQDEIMSEVMTDGTTDDLATSVKSSPKVKAVTGAARRQKYEMLRKKYPHLAQRPCRRICRPAVCCKLFGAKEKKKEREADAQSVDVKPSIHSRTSSRRALQTDVESFVPPEVESLLVGARRQLQMHGKGLGWTQKKQYVQAILDARKARQMQAELSRKRKMRRRIKMKETVKKVEEPYAPLCKPKVDVPQVKSCVPRKPWFVLREIESLLVPPAESILERPGLGKSYLDELEAVRRRIYPRISDFHSID